MKNDARLSPLSVLARSLALAALLAGCTQRVAPPAAGAKPESSAPPGAVMGGIKAARIPVRKAAVDLYVSVNIPAEKRPTVIAALAPRDGAEGPEPGLAAGAMDPSRVDLGSLRAAVAPGARLAASPALPPDLVRAVHNVWIALTGSGAPADFVADGVAFLSRGADGFALRQHILETPAQVQIVKDVVAAVWRALTAHDVPGDAFLTSAIQILRTIDMAPYEPMIVAAEQQARGYVTAAWTELTTVGPAFEDLLSDTVWVLSGAHYSVADIKAHILSREGGRSKVELGLRNLWINATGHDATDAFIASEMQLLAQGTTASQILSAIQALHATSVQSVTRAWLTARGQPPTADQLADGLKFLLAGGTYDALRSAILNNPDTSYDVRTALDNFWFALVGQNEPELVDYEMKAIAEGTSYLDIVASLTAAVDSAQNNLRALWMDLAGMGFPNFEVAHDEIRALVTPFHPLTIDDMRWLILATPATAGSVMNQVENAWWAIMNQDIHQSHMRAALGYLAQHGSTFQILVSEIAKGGMRPGSSINNAANIDRWNFLAANSPELQALVAKYQP